jgi:hypothetical protein
MRHPLNFYTSYNQFYLYDKDSGGATNSNNFWTQEAFEQRLAIEEGIIGVGTECYGPVKGELTVLDAPNNDFNSDLYDHIVEGSIEIKSGELQVLECPSHTIALEVPLEAGTYRVRVYSSNLQSADGDGGDDYYVIELWPAPLDKRRILKQYLV